MKTPAKKNSASAASVCEFLILPGGKILAHNLSPTIAAALVALNPDDNDMSRRANKKLKHELPN